MRRIFNFFNDFPAFKFVFGLLTVMFIFNFVIYTFDLEINGKNSRKALFRGINNEKSTTFLYKVDDQFGYEVNLDPDYRPYINLVAYVRSDIPFCFVCGYYEDEWEQGSIRDAYKIGDIVYTIDTVYTHHEGMPDNHFLFYDLKNKEFGWVKNLTEINPNAADSTNRITPEYVVDNFEELSYQTSEDEDCWIAYGAVFGGYILIFPWFLFNLYISFKREKE